ncbi:unnamed protein product [Symbiodinium natans]|uniref:Uncharacterized protein n=1 Tax=Symbiodinium natans TaxID=878477 RepID=A0A812GGS4_9DINO|nr:unnamed protein product [Symbiodinium natans]
MLFACWLTVIYDQKSMGKTDLGEQCAFVKSQKVRLAARGGGAVQALALQEPAQRKDRRPQSAPSHVLQLQKQLTAKVQEARVLARDSAALAMRCLRSHGGHGDHGGHGGSGASASMSPPVPPRSDIPMATVVDNKFPSSQTWARSEVADGEPKEQPAAEERPSDLPRMVNRQDKPFWTQLGGVAWDEVDVLAAQWSP